MRIFRTLEKQNVLFQTFSFSPFFLKGSSSRFWALLMLAAAVFHHWLMSCRRHERSAHLSVFYCLLLHLPCRLLHKPFRLLWRIEKWTAKSPPAIYVLCLSRKLVALLLPEHAGIAAIPVQASKACDSLVDGSFFLY